MTLKEDLHKIFIEKDKTSKKKNRGAWLVDFYDGNFLLEIFSERSNYKAIYQINEINDNLLKATSINKNGELLSLELEVYREQEDDDKKK